jgi:hypothetical protein
MSLPSSHFIVEVRQRCQLAAVGVAVLQGFVQYFSSGPSRVDVETLNDQMRPAGALRLRHAQVCAHDAAIAHLNIQQHSQQPRQQQAPQVLRGALTQFGSGSTQGWANHIGSSRISKMHAPWLQL